MDATEETPEVYAARAGVAKVGRDDVAFLKEKAARNPRRKCRLLLHQGVDDPLHEMLIVQAKGKYIRPHKNTTSSKSFRIVEGELVCVVFGEGGEVVEHFRMRDQSGDGVFMVRLSPGQYHTLIPLSDFVAYVETILGPFRETPYAFWAPPEGDSPESRAFFEGLCRSVGVDPSFP